MLNEVEKQQRALVDAVLRSPYFQNREALRKLLQHLFYCHLQRRNTTSKEIAGDVLGIDLTKTEDTTAAREDISHVRSALNLYEGEHKDADGWHVRLPAGTPAGGYALEFRKRGELSQTEAFWKAHLDSGLDVFIVCNEPVFFRRKGSHEITRYLDVNTWITDRRGALRDLHARYPDLDHNGMYASYFYLYTGEILAADLIQNWFLDHADLRIPRFISRDLPDAVLKNSSPILLGNSRINRFIDEIMNTEEGQALGYQMSQERFGVTIVRNPKPRQSAQLQSIADSAHYEDGDCCLTDNPQGDVFALVTRLPNPYNDGEGTVTIVSCDYTRALEQIALTLTTDAFLAKSFLSSRWPQGKPVLRTFQALYAVRMGRSNIDAGGRYPRLILAGTPSLKEALPQSDDA